MQDLFFDNIYTTRYFKLMDYRNAHVITDNFEKHHIIPKCMGGTQKRANLVNLSLREHYYAHRLLTKMCRDPKHTSKMNYALHMLCANRAVFNSRQFAVARSALSLANRHREVKPETRKKLSDAAKIRGITEMAVAAAKLANTGRKHTDIARMNMSHAHLGKKFTDAHKKAIGLASTGRIRTEEQRKKQSDRLKENHPRAYEWILISPAGQMMKTQRISEFCRIHHLGYSSLRAKAQQNDDHPIKSGPSKGWSVFGVRKPSVSG